MNATVHRPRPALARRTQPVPAFLRAPPTDPAQRLAAARTAFNALATTSEQILEGVLAQVQPQPGRPTVTAGELLDLAETLRDLVADLGRVLHGDMP